MFAIDIYGKGQMPPLTIPLSLHLAGKTREKRKSKAFTKPMAGYRTTIWLIDHISSRWSLLCLNRVCVHMTSVGFEPQLLVKFPSIVSGESSKVFSGRIMYFAAEKKLYILKTL